MSTIILKQLSYVHPLDRYMTDYMQNSYDSQIPTSIAASTSRDQ